MYRRIEMIGISIRGINSMGIILFRLGLKAPELDRQRSLRFYFTEKGWNKIGRIVLSNILANNGQCRVLKVKENSIDPLYKDEYQVATRPRKKKF
jgi:hypothetical protein